jgi:hypothetical protein
MIVKGIIWLGILLTVILIIIAVNDIAIAKNKKQDKLDNIREVPTLRPTRSPDSQPVATPEPTPRPTQAPTQTPTQTPIPVVQPVSTPTQNSWQNTWPGYDTIPVSTPEPVVMHVSNESQVLNTTAVMSLPPEKPAPTFSPYMKVVEPTGPGKNNGMIIPIIMSLICIAYLTYLGSMMIKR